MEANNMKAMRDALSDACYAMFNFLKTQSGGYEEMANALDRAKAALAAPPRNCDVGTEVEKHRRFIGYCNACDCPMGCIHRKQFVGMLDERCASMLKCYIRWAQMPYEKGGAK